MMRLGTFTAALLVIASTAQADEFTAASEGGKPKPATVAVDFAAACGPVKPMNAVNNGPVGGSADARHGNFAEYRAARIPFARTHDATCARPAPSRSSASASASSTPRSATTCGRPRTSPSGRGSASTSSGTTTGAGRTVSSGTSSTGRSGTSRTSTWTGGRRVCPGCGAARRSSSSSSSRLPRST